MKRRIFATAVVLVVMATPLFGQEAASSKQPAQAAGKTQPTASKSQVTASKLAATPKSSPPKETAPGKQPATATPAKPASPQPSTAAAAAPAPETPKPAEAKTNASAPKSGAPKAPTVRVTAISPKPDLQPATLTPSKGTSSAPKTVPAVAAGAANSVKPPTAVKTSNGPLSPVQEKVQQNKELTREMQVRLPGVDVVSAAEGFQDLRQFVAAANASHNMGISFTSLKAKVLNSKRTSLRQAIQELRPASSAAVEARRAEYDAMGLIATTEAQAAAAAAAAATAKTKPAAPSKPKPPAKQQN